MSSKISLSDDTATLFHLSFSLKELFDEIFDSCSPSTVLYIINEINDEEIPKDATLDDIEFGYFPYIDLDLCEQYSTLFKKEEDESLKDNNEEEDLLLGVITLRYVKDGRWSNDKFNIINAECDNYPGEADVLIQEMNAPNVIQIDKEACERFQRYFSV